MKETERIKYICTQSVTINNGTGGGNHSSMNHHENTFNRLLKFSLNNLKREEAYDVILVHDVFLPYIEEEIIYNLTIEALKHGAASLSTFDVIDNNFLFKFDESNIENPENSPNFMKKGFLRSACLNSGVIADFLNTSNYRIGFKPQSFQYSIFEVIFENVLYLYQYFFNLFNNNRNLNF